VGFAPYEDPKIAVCVVVENVGFGGTHAAPVAQKIFEAYLLRDKKINDDLKKLIDDDKIAEVNLAR
jgi:penicillin-binding protein 2